MLQTNRVLIGSNRYILKDFVINVYMVYFINLPRAWVEGEKGTMYQSSYRALQREFRLARSKTP